MNCLSIDYGTKRVGMAYSINGVISTLPVVSNNQNLLNTIKKIISEYSIDRIYVGLSEGTFAKKTMLFIEHLHLVLELPIESVEESVSTIEADEIYKSNKHQFKNYKKNIDSVAAAVILRRVIN